MQVVIVEGVIGKDPIFSKTEDDREFGTFSLGVRAGKDKEGKPKTSWYSIKVWEKMLGITKKLPLKKGNRIIVVGDLDVSMYNNSPVKTVTATNLTLIYSNTDPNYYTNKQQVNKQEEIQKQVIQNVQYQNFEADDDDLPF